MGIIKNVVITGSSRGLGFEMAKAFCMNGANVVINGINEKRLEDAIEKLSDVSKECKVFGYAGSVASADGIKGLMRYAVDKLGTIDVWINNAGINQPMKAIWELSEDEINSLIDIDLRGAVLGSREAMLQMEKQPEGGFIYNVEGYGSNDAMMLGLNMYGTSKRAVTHFTKAFAKELDERESKVKIGLLSPGMMYTDFMVRSLGDKDPIVLSEKTKKIYNILGDYPDTVADFMVKGIMSNGKNNAKIEWLTGRKVAWRFLTAPFNKRKHFE